MKIVSLSALIDGSWSLPNRSSLRSNLSISFEIGSSRKDCELPQCMTALARFGRHPDSGEGALKKVRHDVKR
jgi:hypothetical protein